VTPDLKRFAQRAFAALMIIAAIAAVAYAFPLILLVFAGILFALPLMVVAMVLIKNLYFKQDWTEDVSDAA